MEYIDEIARVQNTGKELQKFIHELLLAIVRMPEYLKQDKYGSAHNKDAVDLLEYLKTGKGHEIKTFSVPEMDVEYMSNLLKSNHIPFVELINTDPNTHENVHTYLLKDVDYEKKAKKLIGAYLRHIDSESHELDITVFNDSTFGHDYYIANGLTKAELEVFRTNAKEYNFEYVVVHDGNSTKDERTYSIASIDKESLNKCLIDTYADISGKDGKEYLEKMEDMWRGQEDMMNKLKDVQNTNEPVYIVDAANLSKLVEVGPKSYAVHTLAIEHTLKRNGEYLSTPVEKNLFKYDGVDKSIITELRHMERPVYITETEAKSLFGVNHQKHLDIPVEYADDKKREEFKKLLGTRETLPVQKPLHSREERILFGGLKTYSDLPTPIIQNIKSLNLDGVFVYGHDIAYDPKHDAVIKDAIMKSEYFKGVKPADVIEANLHYMKRSRGKIVNLEPGEQYTLYDYSDENFHIDITEQHLSVYEEGKQPVIIPVEDDIAFQETLLDAAYRMNSPLLISTNLYNSKERDDVSAQIIKDGAHNLAFDHAAEMEQSARQALYDASVDIDKEDFDASKTQLTHEQQEILNRRHKASLVKINNQGQNIDIVTTTRKVQAEKNEKSREER